jgi:hypothetical protein
LTCVPVLGKRIHRKGLLSVELVFRLSFEVLESLLPGIPFIVKFFQNVQCPSRKLPLEISWDGTKYAGDLR